ncbi:hypothetical protein [Streptomyces sp. NPDC007088]|uniref:hypothetical protein n=1 Tax=Streptomyces sp. NPDC007088 TaxID=3364773 RepID=UPI00367F29A1
MTSGFRLPGAAGAVVTALLVVLLLIWLPTGYAQAGEPALPATGAPPSPRVTEAASLSPYDGSGPPRPVTGAATPDPPPRDGDGFGFGGAQGLGGLLPWLPLRLPDVVGSRPGDETRPDDTAQSGNQGRSGRPRPPSALPAAPATSTPASPASRAPRTAAPDASTGERHRRTRGETSEAGVGAVPSLGAAFSVPLPPPVPPPAVDRSPGGAGASAAATPAPEAGGAHRAVASRGGVASGPTALGGGLICVGLGLATAFLGLRLRRA